MDLIETTGGAAPADRTATPSRRARIIYRASRGVPPAIAMATAAHVHGMDRYIGAILAGGTGDELTVRQYLAEAERQMMGGRS